MLNYYKFDTLKLKPGDFIADKRFIIDLQKPKPELVKLLQKQNPDLLNSIDAEWQAFSAGEFINDDNYVISKDFPEGYQLRWVFRISGHLLGCFRNNNPEDSDADFTSS